MPAGVRLLPNAVTVVALCSGLSAVYFALSGRFELCVAAGGIAALCDALDGRLARMLDASSRIGAELDSLSDLVSFGVAPALVMYIWALQGTPAGLGRRAGVRGVHGAAARAVQHAARRRAAAVRQGVLRRGARPRGGAAVGPAAVRHAALRGRLVVRARAGGGVGGGRRRADGEPPADVVVQDRAGACAAGRPAAGDGRAGRRGAGDGAVPRAGHRGAGLPVRRSRTRCYRHRWLAEHPEAWNVPMRERRALARSARSARRLGLRSPLRRRVAGRASAMARAVRRFGEEGAGRTNGHGGGGPGPAQPRNRLRLGLRRARRR